MMKKNMWEPHNENYCTTIYGIWSLCSKYYTLESQIMFSIFIYLSKYIYIFCILVVDILSIHIDYISLFYSSSSSLSLVLVDPLICKVHFQTPFLVGFLLEFEHGGTGKWLGDGRGKVSTFTVPRLQLFSASASIQFSMPAEVISVIWEADVQGQALQESAPPDIHTLAKHAHAKA